MLELRSGRIFIDESIGAEAMKAGDKAQGVLTYFVNGIRLGRQINALLDGGGARVTRELLPAGHASR